MFASYLFIVLFQTHCLSIRSRIKMYSVLYSEQNFEPSDCLEYRALTSKRRLSFLERELARECTWVSSASAGLRRGRCLCICMLAMEDAMFTALSNSRQDSLGVFWVDHHRCTWTGIKVESSYYPKSVTVSPT